MIDRMPLKVSCGMGVNSVAMLVGLRRLGIRPDAILFADTGGELRETYDYIPILQGWLESAGFPPLTIVRKASPRTNDASLYDECFRKGMFPSIAYGGGSCAQKWKIQPQDKWCNHWPVARAWWRAGRPVLTAIGYDAGPRDDWRRCRAYDVQSKKPQRSRWGGLKYRYWYPLIDWGWDRADCIRAIESEPLPVPIKSACFFCTSRKAHELDWLIANRPEVFWSAVLLEDRGLAKARSSKGLGRRFSWRDYFYRKRGHPVVAAPPA